MVTECRGFYRYFKSNRNDLSHNIHNGYAIQLQFNFSGMTAYAKKKQRRSLQDFHHISARIVIVLEFQWVKNLNIIHKFNL